MSEQIITISKQDLSELIAQILTDELSNLTNTLTNRIIQRVEVKADIREEEPEPKELIFGLSGEEKDILNTLNSKKKTELVEIAEKYKIKVPSQKNKKKPLLGDYKRAIKNYFEAKQLDEQKKHFGESENPLNIKKKGIPKESKKGKVEDDVEIIQSDEDKGFFTADECDVEDKEEKDDGSEVEREGAEVEQDVVDNSIEAAKNTFESALKTLNTQVSEEEFRDFVNNRNTGNFKVITEDKREYIIKNYNSLQKKFPNIKKKAAKTAKKGKSKQARKLED